MGIEPTNSLTTKTHELRRNRFAFVMSMCIVSPMKAYLSEDFPWACHAVTPVTNFTMFNHTKLIQCEGVASYYDRLQSVQVIRVVLDFAGQPPIPPDKCISSLLLGLPGVFFYPDSIRNILCSYVEMDYKTFQSYMTMLFASTVWYSNAGLCITATYLKRKHKECSFSEVDPTLVAFAATLYSPVAVWMGGNIDFMLAAFHVLFKIPVSAELVDYQFDGDGLSILYTMAVASLPVMYGFYMPKMSKFTRLMPWSGKPDNSPENYGSFSYNSLKVRWMSEL
ncbi:hypothetical protein THRCLA_08106 [Thraustotheca clavata]|uniref:Transmembrane protein n=1 Tax=Thraustotheca clavata TaxID=74557 RepID=A0A1V9Z9U1_9STRA|nr:hypothetical protein THRCLA_08106 [Thraustotheca clavata]